MLQERQRAGNHPGIIAEQQPAEGGNGRHQEKLHPRLPCVVSRLLGRGISYRVPGHVKGSFFFFEKKKQKTFANWLVRSNQSHTS
jgi:hypothetical protein